MTRMLSDSKELDLHATTITSQSLFLAFKQTHTIVRTALQLLLHIQDFELVFTKKDFNTLPDYCWWYYSIEQMPSTKPKLFKVYLLLLVE